MYLRSLNTEMNQSYQDFLEFSDCFDSDAKINVKIFSIISASTTMMFLIEILVEEIEPHSHWKKCEFEYREKSKRKTFSKIWDSHASDANIKIHGVSMKSSFFKCEACDSHLNARCQINS